MEFAFHAMLLAVVAMGSQKMIALRANQDIILEKYLPQAGLGNANLAMKVVNLGATGLSQLTAGIARRKDFTTLG